MGGKALGVMTSIDLVSDPSAITGAANASATGAANASVTASNPTAPTAYSAVTDMTNPVTKTEGETLSAALSTLVGEVTTYETAISANIVDIALILAQADKSTVDIGLILAQADKSTVDIAVIRTNQIAILTALKELELMDS